MIKYYLHYLFQLSIGLLQILIFWQLGLLDPMVVPDRWQSVRWRRRQVSWTPCGETSSPWSPFFHSPARRSQQEQNADLFLIAIKIEICDFFDSQNQHVLPGQWSKVSMQLSEGGNVDDQPYLSSSLVSTEQESMDAKPRTRRRVAGSHSQLARSFFPMQLKTRPRWKIITLCQKSNRCNSLRDADIRCFLATFFFFPFRSFKDDHCQFKHIQ